MYCDLIVLYRCEVECISDGYEHLTRLEYGAQVGIYINIAVSV